MAKKETIPTIIDTPEALTAKMAAMKEAQKIFATYTQEQVDKISCYCRRQNAYPTCQNGR